MTLELNESIEKMSDRQLLELLISNQMYLHFRLMQVESKITREKQSSGYDIVKDAINKSDSFFKHINEELKRISNEQ